MNQDTIAAISTGMTNSGIGIVRISGSEALEIADRVYKGKETITEVPTHTIHYGHVMDGDETVDEVLVMVMRGPRTFTGEDTVEINCHGGTYVVSRVLETVLKAGARPAEPGEFTKRAFLNGKMDLSQAEEIYTKDFFDMILPSTIKFLTDHYIVGDSYRSVWLQLNSDKCVEIEGGTLVELNTLL